MWPPIYKQELLNAIAVIEQLNNIGIKTIGLADLDNAIPFTLEETDEHGYQWQYTFYLKENFRAIKDLSGNWCLSNPKCLFENRKNISNSSAEEVINQELKLRKAHDHIHHKLGLKTAGQTLGDLRILVKQGANPIIWMFITQPKIFISGTIVDFPMNEQRL
jgi:hypothetical protein